MRYRGRDYTGRGVKVAIVDSGIDKNDPRLQGVEIEGWTIKLGATGHAMLGSDCHDENGHGTDIAAAVIQVAPDVKLQAVKIMDERLRTSADLMAAGIETAFRNGAQIINLSLGTPNMGKALLLRDCCSLAVESGSVVLAAAHPKGERAYPADLPETVGVSTSTTSSRRTASRAPSGETSRGNSSRTATRTSMASRAPSAARASRRRS
jgi:subtilisin family serine protease